VIIEQNLFTLLSTVAQITALCGTRIYPAVLPEKAILPAIHYLFVGGSSKATNDTYGVQEYRVEINCWGNSYSDAVTLRNAVRSAIDQYDQNGIFVRFMQPTDFFDHEALQYRAMAEFYIISNFSN
jgi:hypothetical protein